MKQAIHLSCTSVKGKFFRFEKFPEKPPCWRARADFCVAPQREADNFFATQTGSRLDFSEDDSPRIKGAGIETPAAVSSGRAQQLIVEQAIHLSCTSVKVKFR